MNTQKLIISLICSMVIGISSVFAAGTPDNVANLEAVAVNSSSIGLTWDSAVDAESQPVDHYRIYYGTLSVFEGETEEYAFDVDTPDNQTSFVIDELEAGAKYYFSATAISSDSQESEEYSFETDATTESDGGEREGDSEDEEDTEAPTVETVSAPDKIHAKVLFNEAVQLPAEAPDTAFSIVEQVNPANTLTVISAQMDSEDETGKTVLLETSEQTEDTTYLVTAGIGIKDLAGNPIISGSTDSGLFLGSAEEPITEEEEEEVAEEDEGGEETAEEAGETEEEAGETEEEMGGDAQAEDCKNNYSCFLKHLTDCSSGKMTEGDDNSDYQYTLEITGFETDICIVKYTAEKHISVLYAGKTMECKISKGTYEEPEDYRKTFDIEECSGDLKENYKEVEIKDTTPPEDVTGLMLTFREQLEKYIVALNWTASIDSAKDLVDQILYQSLDRGNTYDQGKSLGKDVTSAEVEDLEGGKEYTFKITTKDTSGNESTGAIKSIRLPSTGMGVGLILIGSGLAARRMLRRKNKK